MSVVAVIRWGFAPVLAAALLTPGAPVSADSSGASTPTRMNAAVDADLVAGEVAQAPIPREIRRAISVSVNSGEPARLVVKEGAVWHLRSLGFDVESQIADLPFWTAEANAAAMRAAVRVGLSAAFGPDVLVKPQTDHYRSIDWASTTDAGQVVDAYAAHAAGMRGQGTAIAVIDSGIDADHPFFLGSDGESRIVAESCFVNLFGQDGVPCPGGGETAEGYGAADIGGNVALSHGTHVAGIAAGDASRMPEARGRMGIAPDASIVVSRVFGAPFGTGSDVVKAISWVADQANRYNIVAANLSLGSAVSARSDCATVSDALFAAAVAKARAAGVAIIAAAGNGGSTNSVGTPACSTGVVSVAATTEADVIADFSNVYPDIDVAAPGVRLVSAIPDDDLAAYSGTSMATPVVAGMMAVLSAAYPNVTKDSLTSVMRSSGVKVDDIITKAIPRVDLGRALAALDGVRPPQRVTDIQVEDMGAGRVRITWNVDGDGAAPTRFRVHVGNQVAEVSDRSVTFAGVRQSPAAVRIIPITGDIEGDPTPGPDVNPIDAELPNLHAGGLGGLSRLNQDLCLDFLGVQTFFYAAPHSVTNERQVRVSSSTGVEYATELKTDDPYFGSNARRLTVRDPDVWTGTDVIAQVVGPDGRLGRPVELGAYRGELEVATPTPTVPTRVTARDVGTGAHLTWDPAGNSRWVVIKGDRVIATVSEPSATIPLTPGRFTLGVCAIDSVDARVSSPMATVSVQVTGASAVALSRSTGSPLPTSQRLGRPLMIRVLASTESGPAANAALTVDVSAPLILSEAGTGSGRVVTDDSGYATFSVTGTGLGSGTITVTSAARPDVVARHTLLVRRR